MKYHVSELIALDELQSLMDSFYQATGINHALLDRDGTVLTAVGWKKCCTDFHRKHPEACARCMISDSYILDHLKDGPYVGYECLNGLYDYATPVMIGDEHVATMFTGQLLHEPPDMVRFSRQAKEFGFDEPGYLAAIADVNVVPRERMANVMTFLVSLAEQLGSNGLARLNQLEANVELEIVVRKRTEDLLKAIDLLNEEVAARQAAELTARRSKMELRHLAANQEQVKEDERKRIAREIHDELGQSLLALRIDVTMLQARAGKSHFRLYEKCDDALRSIDATVKSVRRIINNLRPSVLDLSLEAAIEWQVQEFQRRSGTKCILRSSKEIPEMGEQMATAVFRILQESLTNIQRHARASHVDVVLSMAGNHFIMKIIDDGIGIHPDCRRKKNAFGLLGIRERIGLMGGQLHIDSRENSGTELMISIPLGELAATSVSAVG